MGTVTCALIAWPTRAGAVSGIQPGVVAYRCPHGCGWHVAMERHVPADVPAEDRFMRSAKVVDLDSARERRADP